MKDVIYFKDTKTINCNCPFITPVKIKGIDVYAPCGERCPHFYRECEKIIKITCSGEYIELYIKEEKA